MVQQAPTSMVSGADNAFKTKERNNSKNYYWMKNAKGRKVPVPLAIEQDALRRGYVHIDKVIQEDDPADRVKAKIQSSDPMTRLADTMEKVVSGQSKGPEDEKVEFMFNGKAYKTEAAMKGAITRHENETKAIEENQDT